MNYYQRTVLRSLRLLLHSLLHINLTLVRIARAVEKPSTPSQPASVVWHVGNPREEGM